MAMREVVAAIAPRTLQANGAWPWISSQGWKWSEIETKSNPTASAYTFSNSSGFSRNIEDQNALKRDVKAASVSPVRESSVRLKYSSTAYSCSQVPL